VGVGHDYERVPQRAGTKIFPTSIEVGFLAGVCNSTIFATPGEQIDILLRPATMCLNCGGSLKEQHPHPPIDVFEEDPEGAVNRNEQSG
jgi:hypothetical protein